MRALVAFAMLAGVAASTVRADDARAFVEIETSKEACFVGEPVRVTLRFGIDAAYFAEHAVQPYRQQLDVPVKIDVGPEWRLDGPEPAERTTFVLNEAKASATQVEPPGGDSRFTVYEVERHFVWRSSGTLVFPAPTLRFAYTTRFEESFAEGRIPVDRHDAVIEGKAPVIRVLELPTAGRPPEFSGAIGRFAVRAEAAPREVEAGESLQLVLRIEGEGDLTGLAAPRLDDVGGFHVYGTLDEVRNGLRTVTYDVAPLSADVTEVPPIPFAYFDPGPPAAYHVVRTEAIPLTVRAKAGAAPASREAAPAAVPDTPVESPSASGWFVVLAGALGVAGVVAWLLWRRSRDRAPVDPAVLRAAGAAAAFEAAVQADGADVADALAEFLAARLACAPAAVVTPDLEERLVRAGADSDVAARTARLLETLVAARFGGAQPDAAGPAAARAAAAELVAALDEVLHGAL